MKKSPVILALLAAILGVEAQAAPDFSLAYTMLRPGLEGRALFGSRGFPSLNTNVVTEGVAGRFADDYTFPSLHADVDFGFYGFLKVIDMTRFADIGIRSGVEVGPSIPSDYICFLKGGIRLHLEPDEIWFFELASFPMVYSFTKSEHNRHVELFARANLSLGIGYVC